MRHSERTCAVAEKDVDVAAGSNSKILVSVAIEIPGGSGGSRGEHGYRLSVECPIAVTQKHCATDRHVKIFIIGEIRNQDVGGVVAAKLGRISSEIGERTVSIAQ